MRSPHRISNAQLKLFRHQMASLSSSTQRAAKRLRRFAPLRPELENNHDAPKLKGIVFDVDGTLCLPQNYMFREMRTALDIPKSVDILDHIHSLSAEPDDEAPSIRQKLSEAALLHTAKGAPPPNSPRGRAAESIREIERKAMTSQRPQPGLEELMTYLDNKGVRKALCTRNFPAPVHHLLDTYLPGHHFDPIITRETEGVEPKPSPEGLWKIAESWGLSEEVERNAKEDGDPLELAKRYLGAGLIMVGDSADDVAAGYRAGAATVLLVNDENEALVEHKHTDMTVRKLEELIEVLEKGFGSNT